MTYYSHNEPRQLFLDTLLDFYTKMGERSFWAKTDEQRQLILDAVNQDYFRVDHGIRLEQDAISLQAALDEYIRRQVYMVGQLSRVGYRVMRIYISGPYTIGDVAVNVKRALDAGDKVLEKGHIPFVPHLTHFWHFISPKPWETWMEIDKEWIPLCDALLRLPGESKGADIEVEYAESMGMLIFTSLEEIP